MRNQISIFLIRLTAVIAAGTALYMAFLDFGLHNLEYITSAFRSKIGGS